MRPRSGYKMDGIGPIDLDPPTLDQTGASHKNRSVLRPSYGYTNRQIWEPGRVNQYILGGHRKVAISWLENESFSALTIFPL